MAQLKDLLVMGPARFLQKAYIGSSDSYGNTSQPIYWNNGVPTATTYSLSATINSSGTANRMTYYSGTNTISAASNHIYDTNSYTLSNTNGDVEIGFRIVGKNHTTQFLIGSGNNNRGWYDNTLGKWAIYMDTNKNIYLQGVSNISTSPFFIGAKRTWNDANAGWYIGTDGTMHGQHSTGEAYIGLHRANSTAATAEIGTTSTGALRISGTASDYTYNNRTKSTILRVQGCTVHESSVEAAEYMLVNRNSSGAEYYMYAENQQYGALYISALGTTSDVGRARLNLGNSIASGTAKNARGEIYIYGNDGTCGVYIAGTSYGYIELCKASGNNYYKDTAGTTGRNYWGFYSDGQSFLLRTKYGGSATTASSNLDITISQTGQINISKKTSGLTIASKGAIWHNGTNLWIGSTATNDNVFTGNLYLNGGLDSNSKRNRVAYLSLGASSDATTGTSYPIVHKNATGSATQGIYLDSNGKTFAMTYSLSATVNAGTQYFQAEYGSGGTSIGQGGLLRIPTLSYTTVTPGNTAGGETFYKAAIAYITNNFTTNASNLIGVFCPNSKGPFIGHIYDVTVKNSDNYPQYSTFIYHGLGSGLESFGTNNYSYYYRRYLYKTSSSNAVGDDTTPVYINSNGEVCACTALSKLSYSTALTSDSDLDSFLEANKFKVASFYSCSGTGLDSGDGMILSMPYGSDTTYGAQIIIDDNTTGIMKFRGKDSSWGSWNTVLHENNYTTYTVQKNGTGASGTWGISISGAATKVTQTASTIQAWRKVLISSESTTTSAVTAITSGSQNTPYYCDSVAIYPYTGALYANYYLTGTGSYGTEDLTNKAGFPGQIYFKIVS